MEQESHMPLDQALTIMGLTELPASIEEYKKLRNDKLMAINRETHGELMSNTQLMTEFNDACQSVKHRINNPPIPSPEVQEQEHDEPFNPFDPRTWPDTQETREYITWKWVNPKKGQDAKPYQVGIAKASKLRWPNNTDEWPAKLKLLDEDTISIYTMAEHNKRCAIYKRKKPTRSSKGPIHILNDAGPTMSRH